MANPIFSEQKLMNSIQDATYQGTMTAQGAMNKVLTLSGICFASAAGAWYLGVSNPSMIGALAIGGGIVGFILCIVLSFKNNLAPTLAPIYAVAEGLFVGAITLVFESMYPGIALSAALISFGVLAAMIGLYKTGVLKATPTFRRTIYAATAGVAFFYLIAMVLRWTGVYDMSIVYGSGWFGIGFSLFVVGLAAFNLIIDLDNMEMGEQHGAPKYMEWYCAFGMLVTIVWLYIEVLRLLSKISSRD